MLSFRGDKVKNHDFKNTMRAHTTQFSITDIHIPHKNHKSTSPYI